MKTLRNKSYKRTPINRQVKQSGKLMASPFLTTTELKLVSLYLNLNENTQQYKEKHLCLISN